MLSALVQTGRRPEQSTYQRGAMHDDEVDTNGSGESSGGDGGINFTRIEALFHAVRSGDEAAQVKQLADRARAEKKKKEGEERST